jgi:hypothetical protein
MHILSLFASFSYPFWYLHFKALLSVIYFSKSRSKIREQIKIMSEIYLAYKQTATRPAHRPRGGRRRRELGRPPWLSSACCTSPCRARGGAPRRWRGELGQPSWPSTRRARARGEATPPMLSRVWPSGATRRRQELGQPPCPSAHGARARGGIYRASPRSAERRQ